MLPAVKLGRCLGTLPERLAPAKSRAMGHAELLKLVLCDEVTRRATTSARLRPHRRPRRRHDLENWDPTIKVNYDHQVFDKLCSLGFIDAGHTP